MFNITLEIFGIILLISSIIGICLTAFYQSEEIIKIKRDINSLDSSLNRCTDNLHDYISAINRKEEEEKNNDIKPNKDNDMFKICGDEHTDMHKKINNISVSIKSFKEDVENIQKKIRILESAKRNSVVHNICPNKNTSANKPVIKNSKK